MKKSLLLFLIVLIVKIEYAQPYYKLLPKDTMTWQHFDCFVPVMRPMENTSFPFLTTQSIAAIDTITINTYRYKKIYNLNNYGLNYSFKLLIGYMREDTISKKVYFRESNISQEYLIYDFSLSVGDSIMLTFPNSASSDGYYRADSIIIKNERCGPRKHFYLRKHLNNPNPNLFYLDHIESIGSNYHILYIGNISYLNYGCQFASNNGSCSWQWTIGLSCKNNNLVKQYQSCTFTLAQMNGCINPVDSCNYHNGCSNIKTSGFANDFNISPNPANNFLRIDFNETLKEKMTIKITDLVGKIVLIHEDSEKTSSRGEIQINTREFENGIYFIRIEIENNIYIKEFAISH